MLVVMQSHATDETSPLRLPTKIESLGLKAHPHPWAPAAPPSAITGNKRRRRPRHPRVPSPVWSNAFPVTKPYKLVSLDVKSDPTIVRHPHSLLGDVSRRWRTSRHDCRAPCGCRKPKEQWPRHRPATESQTGVRLFPRAAPTSPAHLALQLSRDSASPGLKILAQVRKHYGFGIVLPKAIDNESLDLVERMGPTSSRSVPATCRIFPCSNAPAAAKKAGAPQARHVRHAR